MPVRNRRPEDERPLIKAVQGPGLVRPVSGPQEEEAPTEAGSGQATATADGTGQAEKGPVTRAVERAQENNWVYPSVANKAKETGLLDKADEIFSRIRAQLGG